MIQANPEIIKKYSFTFDEEVKKGNYALSLSDEKMWVPQKLEGKKQHLWAYCEQKEPFIALALGRGYWEAMGEDERRDMAAGYAWTIIDSIKRAETLIKEHRDDKKVCESLRQVCREWAILLGRLPVLEEDTRLLKLRAHYGVKYIGTETHLRDAFLSARVAYENHPEDIQVIHDYIYILWDCIAQAIDSLKNRELVQMFSEEMKKLVIPEEESACCDTQKRALMRAEAFLTGEKDLRHEAYEASKDKDYVKAIRSYIELLKSSPEDMKLQTSLGWAIYYRLKELTESKDSDHTERAANILHQVKHICQIERPSALYSSLMLATAKLVLAFDAESTLSPAVADAYLAFVNALGVNALSEDDYKPYIQPETHKTYESVCERITKAIYRASKASNSQLFPDAWLAFFKGSVEMYPAQEWFPYYFSKLLIRANRHVEARDYLLKVVRLKRDDFWAWTTLADTFKQDMDKELACLCRAALCAIDEDKFKKRLHERLQSAFKSRGMTDAASGEAQLLQTHKRPILKTVATACHRESPASYMEEVPTPLTSVDNTPLYRQYADLANALVMESAPQLKAILAGRETKERMTGGEVQFLQIGYQAEAGVYTEITCKGESFPQLEGVVLGVPLSIRLETSKGREEICDLTLRNQGSPWDIYPSRQGVVVENDQDKGVSYVMFEEKRPLCYVEHKRLPQSRAMGPGSLVEIKYRHNPIRDAYTAVALQLANPPITLPFCKPFAGELRIQPGHTFGFIDTIYVPKSLLPETHEEMDGLRFHGFAILSYDKKKAKNGWKAITLFKD